MKASYMKLLGAGSPAPSNNGATQTAQQQLANHGHDPGVRHGLLDIPTRNAIVSFQRSKGLQQTGKLDNPTQSALQSQPHKRAGQSTANSGTTAARGTTAMNQSQVSAGAMKNALYDSTATTVGPNFTLQLPSVGATPQIAGAVNTAVPGTLFDPRQCGALDWKMMIANQGNAISVVVNNTNTTLAIAFVALLFGHEVGPAAAPRGTTSGVAPAGAYRA